MVEAKRTPVPLGRHMDNRRRQLGLTWREVAHAAGLTYETVRAIRFGDNQPQGLTRTQIDRALRWEEGSTERFLADGTAPAPLDRPGPEPDRATAAAVLFPGDTVAQAIMAQDHKSDDEIRSELGNWLSRNRAHQALHAGGNEPGTIPCNR
jgi:hypothetical protein